MNKYFKFFSIAVIFSGMFYSFRTPIKSINREDTKNETYRFGAEVAKINTETTEILADERLSNLKGMALKTGIATSVDGGRDEPDLVFNVKMPKAGRYKMGTFAVTDAEGAELMKK